MPTVSSEVSVQTLSSSFVVSVSDSPVLDLVIPERIATVA